MIKKYFYLLSVVWIASSCGSSSETGDTSGATNQEPKGTPETKEITLDQLEVMLSLIGSRPAMPHAVRSVGAETFSYNLNGQMVGSSTGLSITYDGDNRTTSINGTNYYYNARGERRKIENGVGDVKVTPFGEHYQVDTFSGQVKLTVAIGRGLQAGPVIRYENGTPKFLHTDHQGSVRKITDENRNIVERNHFTSWGERQIVQTSHQTTPYGFTGMQHEASGLVRLGVRYYHPKIRRFVSPDPTIPTSDAVGLNRYAYALNDPINLEDRSGYAPINIIKTFQNFVKAVENSAVAKAVAVIAQELYFSAVCSSAPGVCAVAGVIRDTILSGGKDTLSSLVSLGTGKVIGASAFGSVYSYSKLGYSALRAGYSQGQVGVSSFSGTISRPYNISITALDANPNLYRTDPGPSNFYRPRPIASRPLYVPEGLGLLSPPPESNGRRGGGSRGCDYNCIDDMGRYQSYESYQKNLVGNYNPSFKAIPKHDPILYSVGVGNTPGLYSRGTSSGFNAGFWNSMLSPIK